MARETWHPILAAREVQPGEWWMVDPGGIRFAIVRVVGIEREGRPSTVYRAVTGERERRDLIAYAPTLRAACARAHEHYVSLTRGVRHDVRARERPDYPIASREYERAFGGTAGSERMRGGAPVSAASRPGAAR